MRGTAERCIAIATAATWRPPYAPPHDKPAAAYFWKASVFNQGMHAKVGESGADSDRAKIVHQLRSTHNPSSMNQHLADQCRFSRSKKAVSTVTG
jgi:hypothetical protein